MKLYPVGRIAWIPVYNRACPKCGAPSGHYCVTADGRPARPAHRCRGNRPEASPLPDLSHWWRAMAVYEGQFARPRPADLVIP